MRDAGNARQTVCKRRKMERKKTIAVIWFHSDELEKFWQALGGFYLDPGYLSESQDRDESKRQTMFVSIFIGHSRKLAKIPIPNHLYQAFDQAGKSFSEYKLGTNWYTKCKLKTDKKFKEHGKYIPRKRKTCNKQRVEQFLTLISVGSR